MARIRTIKPDFWSHEKVMDCPRDARLLFIGLLNFADDEGRMRLSPRSLKAQIFPGDDISTGHMTDILEQLADVGLIETYEVDEKRYLLIPGFREHQRIDKFVSSKLPPPPVEDERAHGGLDEASTSPRAGREGKGRDSHMVADATGGGGFEELWQVRLRRDGPDPREPARRAFAEAVRRGAETGVIVAGMRRFAEIFHDKSGTRYVARTEKWLRERQWEDYQPSVALDPRAVGQVWLRQDDDRFKAWDRHHRSTRGRGAPTDARGGWLFPSEWPPGHEKHQKSGTAAPALPFPPKVVGGAG